jgi:hypothetical protein
MSTAATLATSVKKTPVKKPYLPAKYAKNLVFGYWLIENLKEKELLPDTNAAFDYLHLFAEVQDQKLFLDTFFEEDKSITKEMKALIRAHNKPPKKTPVKKTSAAVAVGEEPKKRGRKKVVQDPPALNEQDQLIANLVAAANDVASPDKKGSATTAVNNLLANVEPICDAPRVTKKAPAKKNTDAQVNDAGETAPKKAPAKKTPAKKVAENPVQGGVEDNAPAPKVNKKTVTKKSAEEPVSKQPPTAEPTQPVAVVQQNNDADADADDDEEEVEIEATPFHFNGVDYLIDANNQLYHPVTFDMVGTYDSNLRKIT